MSTPLKVIIMLVAWFVYSLLAYQGCVRPCCDGAVDGEKMTASPPPEGSRYPIDFSWDNPQPFTNAGFDAMSARLVSEMSKDNILEITGMYYESEAAPAGFQNMGFARAEQVKQLFAGRIPPERIVTRARALDDDEAAKTGYFEAADLSWAEPEKQEGPDEVEVVELPDRIIIYFPFASDQQEVDPKVEEYLNQLSVRLKQTQEKVRLVGHTDNVGDAAANLRLGAKRAEAVKNTLVKKGIAADRITTESKGQTQPEDTNDTDAGRRNNRRVEVRLVAQ